MPEINFTKCTEYSNDLALKLLKRALDIAKISSSEFHIKEAALKNEDHTKRLRIALETILVYGAEVLTEEQLKEIGYRLKVMKSDTSVHRVVEVNLDKKIENFQNKCKSILENNKGKGNRVVDELCTYLVKSYVKQINFAKFLVFKAIAMKMNHRFFIDPLETLIAEIKEESKKHKHKINIVKDSITD